MVRPCHPWAERVRMKGACGPLSSLLLALPLLALVLVLLSLLYSLLLLCAAVACSGLPHNREGVPSTPQQRRAAAASATKTPIPRPTPTKAKPTTPRPTARKLPSSVPFSAQAWQGRAVECRRSQPVVFPRRPARCAQQRGAGRDPGHPSAAARLSRAGTPGGSGSAKLGPGASPTRRGTT